MEEIIIYGTKDGVYGPLSKADIHAYLGTVPEPAPVTPVVVPPVAVPEPEPTPAPAPIPAPKNPLTIDDQIGMVGVPFSFTLPASSERIDVSDLPPGLRFDGDTRTISGTPTAVDSRTLIIRSVTGAKGAFGLTIISPVKPGPAPPKSSPAPAPAPEQSAPNRTTPAPEPVNTSDSDPALETDIEILTAPTNATVI